MPPILRNTPKSYRSCILYEVQLGRSIVEAYKNVCRNTKNDKFDSVEFVYWFNRFANGKFDLDNESFDIQPKSFSDLPYDILGEIVGKLDTKSQLRTRKVSRFLRSVVDNQPQYGEIDICFDEDGLYIQYKTHLVVYEKYGDKCVIYERREDGYHIGEKVLNGDSVDIALDDLAIALKNPKLQLKNFELIFDEKADTYDEKFLKFFESLKSPIHVENVRFDSGGAQFVLPVLSLLKPGTLEQIGFDRIPSAEMFANQLVMTEQWKQARYFYIDTPMPVGLENFSHFKVFSLTMGSISTDDVIFLRDNLPKCLNFVSCHLDIHRSYLSISDIKQIREAFGEGRVAPSQVGAETSHRLSIAGSIVQIRILG